MVQAARPQKVKLIVGLIAKKDYIEPVIHTLERKFGPLDFQSDVFEFKHTDYYFKEMGKPLYRKFTSFKELISPAHLWKIKLYTNKLERKFSKGDRRQVNIDPSYLALSKLVLASVKNFSHRIYLNGGIYAEVTLIYQNDKFKCLEWTFPEYRSSTYRQIFRQIRDIYARQIKERKNIG